MTLDGRQFAEFLAVRDRLLGYLTVATTMRHDRLDSVADPVTGQSELGWVAFERALMLEVTNRERAALGKPAASEAAVRFAEGRAHGHVDYAQKFTLGCAEIVYDLADPTTGYPAVNR